MGKSKLILLFFGCAVITVIVFHFLYSSVNVIGGLKLETSPEDIKKKATIFSNETELKVEGARIDAAVNYDYQLIQYLQKSYGIKSGNKYLRDSLPGYFWAVTWRPKGVSGITIGSSDKKDKSWEQYLEEIAIQYDSKGRLIKFNEKLHDTVALPAATRNQALINAEKFLIKYAKNKNLGLPDSGLIKSGLAYPVKIAPGIILKEEIKTDYSNRTDYQFVWADSTGPGHLVKNIFVSVSGDRVTSFRQEFSYPKGTIAEEEDVVFNAVSTVVFYVVVFVLLAIIAYRKTKAYEIGFRLALILGIITVAASGIEIYLELNSEFTWELLIPLIVGPLFIAAAIILVWAAGEAIARETWKEKFISIDLATKGYALHSKVGKSVLEGLSAGLAAASASLLLLLILQYIFSISVRVDEGAHLNHFKSVSPGLNVLLKNIYAGIFSMGVFFIFIVSGLKRRFNSAANVILICGILWGITNSYYIQPFYLDIIYGALIGAFFVFLFIRKDVLTTLFAVISFNIIIHGYTFFTIGNSEYYNEGIFLLIIFIFISVVAIISLFTEDKINEYDTVSPAFAKNITERQRLQRELEIARDVQMSFLPKKVPLFPGLDVASRCIPALEVGGDYYDFVELDKNRLGIIIGDVSGKGTQAAFYMTLTKGFLKALSKTSGSPSEVLSGMNELFYENVERGTFISMIYGIFDTDKKSFRLSRAGHNPVILQNSPGKVEILNPTGLALGLEKGNLFNKTIKEIEVSYNKGDVFLFYTDGFTEALNRKREEYGEERLIKDIGDSNDLSASEILEKIIKNTKQFMGSTKQHDDMTLVVVKVI